MIKKMKSRCRHHAKVIIAVLLFGLVFSACEKQEPLLVPYDETHIEIDDPNADEPITIHKFVIHQMDFIHYQDFDASIGPDLYFLGYPDVTLSTGITYNVTPAMMPLTITCDIACEDKIDAENFWLLDYDVAPLWMDDNQDIMMSHSGYTSGSATYYSVFAKYFDEEFDGTYYYLTSTDVGSNLVFSVYYTYN